MHLERNQDSQSCRWDGAACSVVMHRGGHQVIGELEGEALGLRRQLGERDEALAERERAVGDLRRKGAEADKVRYI